MAKRERLAIVGTASTKGDAPYDDTEWDIWGMSSLTEDPECKRLDRAFEFHPKRYWGQLSVLMRLNKFDGPVYMQEHTDEIPNSVAYPVDEIRQKFHIDAMGSNLFVTNSITWMILLGIHEGYRHFALYGVHMRHDEEYSYQKPSCSWALGIIQGLALAGGDYSIHLPDESELLKARYEYGFDEPSELMLELDTRKKRLQMGVDNARKQQEAAKVSEARTDGALQEATYWYNRVAGFR